MIEADVLQIARRWGLDPALVQAVVTAEGNIIKAVQCSVPSVTTRAEALDVLCRSCTHALCDFVIANTSEGFVTFWQRRWAPTGVANDPKHLNENWARNVLALWKPKPTTSEA